MNHYIYMYRQSQYKSYAEAIAVGGSYSMKLPVATEETEAEPTFAHPVAANALAACRMTADCLGETRLNYILVNSNNQLLDVICD